MAFIIKNQLMLKLIGRQQASSVSSLILNFGYFLVCQIKDRQKPRCFLNKLIFGYYTTSEADFARVEDGGLTGGRAFDGMIKR